MTSSDNAPITEPRSRHRIQREVQINYKSLALSLLMLVQSPEGAAAFMKPPTSQLTVTLCRNDIFSLQQSEGAREPHITSGRHPRKAKLAKKTLTKSSAASRAVMLPARTSKLNQPIRTNQSLYRLTHGEEMSLLRTMRSHPTGSPESQAARQTLLVHNLPLVQSLVSKAMRSHPRLLVQGKESQIGAALSMDDLLNEGTIGLAEALDKYDFTYSDLKNTGGTKPQGARFGTYATYWIRARITRAIQSREHAFRFPERTLQASHRLVKAARILDLDWSTVTELQNADTPEKEKLRSALCGAAAINSDAQFREAIRVRNMSTQTTTTQLESWMSAPSSADQMHLEVNERPEPNCKHIHDTLSKFLGPKEVQVLSLRYGLAVHEEGNNNSKAGLYRDYQAEAEEDLFGPDGILSHYSDVPLVPNMSTASKNDLAETGAKKYKTRKASPNLTKSHRINLSTTTALLPFKEVGKKMKISGEYCRRLCTEALRKLSLAVEEGRLAESDFLMVW